MILLTSTSDLLRLVTDGTETIDVHVSYVDISGTTVTPGRLNTAINSATTTTIVASPAPSTQRNVKTIHVRNKDATDAVVIFKHTDGSTLVELFSATLAANAEIQYTDALGFLML